MEMTTALARAIALQNAGKLSEADAIFTAVLAGQASGVDSLVQWAMEPLQRGDLLGGLPLVEAAVRLAPKHAFAQNLHGMILSRLGRFAEAIPCHERAITIAPTYGDAYEDRGVALQNLGQLERAVPDFLRAVELNPDSYSAWSNLSYTLSGLHRYEEAASAAEQALRLRPDADMLPGELFYCRTARCDWREWREIAAKIDAAVEAGGMPIQPFKYLSAPTDPAHQLKNAERFAKQFPPAAPPQLVEKHDRIRVGYFSADFHKHATSYLMAELFELHDRSRFEIIGFAFGNSPRDAMRLRLERAFDKFFDVSHLSDAQITMQAREHGLDIAVDLKGYTTSSRAGVFARRAAPIQVNYLGFPGTMGASFIDYIIADDTVIPPGETEFYAEKVVLLPDSYQVNDSKRSVAERVFTRAELGLPAQGFVFCCFNNSFKISPDAFDIWMRLLRETPGSVLWLMNTAGETVSNLKSAAQARGVSAERLVFADMMELPDHLARHRCADLFLDTFYYNAHTTASDALWAGVPVVTRLGNTFAGRVGASLLRAVGMSDLITTTNEDYYRCALSLAHDSDRLEAVRGRLLDGRTTAALFNTKRFARHIETAFAAMCDQARAGAAPDHIRVQAISA